MMERHLVGHVQAGPQLARGVEEPGEEDVPGRQRCAHAIQRQQRMCMCMGSDSRVGERRGGYNMGQKASAQYKASGAWAVRHVWDGPWKGSAMPTSHWCRDSALLRAPLQVRTYSSTWWRGAPRHCNRLGTIRDSPIPCHKVRGIQHARRTMGERESGRRRDKQREQR